MTVELLPNVVAAPSRPRLRGTTALSWGAFVLDCACGAAEPDCLYCSGPESD
ncbi:hypothetical protein [Kocuria turfanensis]|uniref:Uncharacterized protein n=1 Tax=Kocuria turfanensis TaxID=388357 RepID=A0A512IEE4_9MICC|nr:hypothetical protein [Kocuria turfanensis]GEO96068.1 hypothetical protein KTU01_21910 [Kocuria turfanensis]